MDNNIFLIGQYVSGIPWENLTKEYQYSIDKEEYIEDPHSVPVTAVEEFSGHCDYYYDEDEFNDYIDTLIPDAPKYLVFMFKGTWDNRSGYKAVDTKRDCFYFDYDSSLYLKKKYETIIRFTLHSHDVPMGTNYVVMTLTEEEASTIDSLSWEEVISLGKKKLGGVENE